MPGREKGLVETGTRLFLQPRACSPYVAFAPAPLQVKPVNPL